MANEKLHTQMVWQPKSGIIKSDYPGVNWDDRAAIAKDPRFGSWVAVPVFGLTADEFTAAAADGIVTETEWNDPATIVKTAAVGLGIWAVLAL